MHIPDGVLDTKTWATSYVISTAVMAGVFRRLKDSADPVLMGLVAALIFAAQLVNIPIFSGTSGHFLGGALAAYLLGPGRATVVMASVVIVQALLFRDGGVMALGANLLNMAILGPWVAWWVYRSFPGRTGFREFAGAFASVLMPALSAATMIALAGYGSSVLFAGITLWHTVIGAGEGLLTVAALSYIRGLRPDLIYGGGLKDD